MNREITIRAKCYLFEIIWKNIHLIYIYKCFICLFANLLVFCCEFVTSKNVVAIISLVVSLIKDSSSFRNIVSK